MVNFEFKEKYDISDLLKIMEILRGPEGCPWDAEQDHKSIRSNFIEEVYEAIEAIDTDNTSLLREELGDVLLQIVFHAQMENEEGRFDFDDVANDICQKLIIRHPHVFGDVKVNNSDEVLTNWDEIKKKTKSQDSQTETMKSVSNALPALMRSQKVQKKAAKVGFDWDNISDVVARLEEEVEELKQAIASKDIDAQQDELGDVLFSAVNVSRFINVDPEHTLTLATDKFISRFALVEKLAVERGVDMKHASLEELDCLWDDAKKML